MVYEVPTHDEFRTFIPELVVEDAEIDPLLLRASLLVDPNKFAEPDYKPAIMYLAAHFLVLVRSAQAQPSTGGGDTGGGGDTTIQTYISETRIADRSVKYGLASKSTSTKSAAGGETGVSLSAEFFNRTMYGAQFVLLRRRNIIAVAVV